MSSGDPPGAGSVVATSFEVGELWLSGRQSPPSSSWPSGNQSGPASPLDTGDSLAWVGLGSQVARAVGGDGGLRAITSSAGRTRACMSASGGPSSDRAPFVSMVTVLFSGTLGEGQARGFGSRKLRKAMPPSSPS